MDTGYRASWSVPASLVGLALLGIGVVIALMLILLVRNNPVFFDTIPTLLSGDASVVTAPRSAPLMFIDNVSQFDTGAHFQVSAGPCGSPGADACADVGEPGDEAFHNLVGWGLNEIGGPIIPPSGDPSKRFQLLRGDNSLTLLVPQANSAYTLFTEVEDGVCDDSFQLHINGQGPIYTYYANPSINTGLLHSVVVSATLIPTTNVVVTYRNIASDGCGLAAVFNVQLMLGGGPGLCQIPSVPLYKQCDPPWGDDPYGASGWGGPEDTMCRWGCSTTSAAMLISYYGAQTTPGALNNWLRAHGGYSGGQLNWYKVAEYARDVGGIQLLYLGAGPRDDNLVNSYLCSAAPMILHTDASPYTGGHFLVARGQAGATSWNTNDPGGYNWQTINYDDYDGIRTYTRAVGSLSSLYIAGHSPIELLITDPAGRRTGYDPATGQYLYEIPEAYYETETIGAHDGSGLQIQARVFDARTPASGAYAVRLIAVGTGAYYIDFGGYDEAGGNSQTSLGGAIAEGADITVTLSYSVVPGSQVSVTVPANLAPLADAGGPYQAVVGQPFVLNASGSADPEGDPLAYRWDVNDNGVWDINWTDQPTVTYTYMRPGAYTIRLEVADGLHIVTSTTSATVSGNILFIPIAQRSS